MNKVWDISDEALYQEASTFMEVNHYVYYENDSFGLEHTGYNSDKKKYEATLVEVTLPEGGKISIFKPRVIQVANSGYQYQYNGKEWQDELGYNMYDMDMRQYDPTIARWIVLDPVVHHSMSPYNAFDDNPVFWADPSGADTSPFEKYYNDLPPKGGGKKPENKPEFNLVNEGPNYYATDYDIDKKGNVKRKDPKDGSENNLYDALYSEDGTKIFEIIKNSTNESTAISDLSKNEIAGNNFAVISDMFIAVALFMVVAEESTSVEWQISYFNDEKFVLSTSHKQTVTTGDSLGIDCYNYNNLVFGMHSHRFTNGPSIFDRGYNEKGQEIPSILNRTKDFTKQFSVYHIYSHTFYPYNYLGTNKAGVKKINNSIELLQSFLKRYKHE